MVKSLGDYNKEKSSSYDTKNIKWSKKNPLDLDKSKKKKSTKKKISPLNIIPRSKNEKTVEKEERIFKVEEDSDEDKSKNQILNRKFEKSSVSNSKIEPGFKRKAR
ncbi:MAG: hypothetical protein ISR81_02980 [Nitrosopumilus sp.]|nr:hypothetical protein [Nitrosopumilus sp.]MBL7017861.1 hypothetical protein [Nitrosopumilus sp.]